VALGAVAFNVARAVGPALAGAIAAAVGSGSAMLAAAVFFSVMIISVRGWKSPGKTIPGVPETLFSGIEAACASRGTRRRCAADPSQPELHGVRKRTVGAVAWS
jgi:hypothetical protein